MRIKCEKCGVEGYKKKENERVLGFFDAVVMPGAKALIVARPQVRFKGKVLYIPPRLGERFIITDIKVGYYSAFVSIEHVSAISFSQQIEGEVEGRAFDFDTAQVGQCITIEVINVGQSPSEFEASLFGYDIP